MSKLVNSPAQSNAGGAAQPPQASGIDPWGNAEQDGGHASNVLAPSATSNFFAKIDLNADASVQSPSYTFSAPAANPADPQTLGASLAQNAASPSSASASPSSAPKKKGDTMESKFRIGLQSFKEKVGAERWKSVFGEQAGFQVTRTPEVDAATQRIKSMEAYYQGLEKSLTAYAKSVKQLAETQGDLSRYWMEQGFKESDENLRVPHIDIGTADQAAAKELAQYSAVVENVRSAVSTMLKNAIADASDTARRQESARQEMDGFSSKLQTVYEKAQEKATKTGKTLADLPKEAKEIEAAKAQLDAANEKYKRLTTQLLDKAGMLDAKRTADIPEQIGALKRSGLHYYAGAFRAFQQPPPGESTNT